VPGRLPVGPFHHPLGGDELVQGVGQVVGLVLDAGGLDALLERVARRRQKRGDPLGGHAALPHEVLPGPLGEPEPEAPLALLQPGELRHVRRRQPYRAGGREDRERNSPS
jgi:hypothetical protein